MIPDRYRPLVDELSALIEQEDVPEEARRIFSRLAVFVTETVSSDFLEDGIEEAVGLRLDDVRRGLLQVGPAVLALDTRVNGLEARLSTLELALTETNKRITPADERLPEATKTIFTIPVVLAEGVDDERIREEIAKLPVGLDGPQVVDELVKLGIVERAR